MDSSGSVLKDLVLGCSPLGATQSKAERKKELELQGQPPENPESGLSGARIPSCIIQTEKPEHRHVILLKLLGNDTQEIAEKSGYSENYILNILAQPWARRQEARLLEDSETKQLISMMLSQSAAGSIKTLLEIRDDKKAPPAVRASAANSLLDRYLGKAVQQVKMAAVVKETEDVQMIDQQLEQLRARQNDLVGRPKLREPAPFDNNVS